MRCWWKKQTTKHCVWCDTSENIKIHTHVKTKGHIFSTYFGGHLSVLLTVLFQTVACRAWEITLGYSLTGFSSLACFWCHFTSSVDSGFPLNSVKIKCERQLEQNCKQVQLLLGVVKPKVFHQLGASLSSNENLQMPLVRCWPLRSLGQFSGPREGGQSQPYPFPASVFGAVKHPCFQREGPPLPMALAGLLGSDKATQLCTQSLGCSVSCNTNRGHTTVQL